MFSTQAFPIKPGGIEPGHLGYILTDQIGQRQVWEVGPSVSFPSSSDSSSSSSSDDPLYYFGSGSGSGGISNNPGSSSGTFWGTIVLREPRNPLPYMEETKINISVNPANRTCEKVQCIERVLQFIDAQHINYNPLGTNSNAGAMTTFRDYGLVFDDEGAKKIFADPITRRTFLGWDIDLTPYINNVSSTDLLYHWFHY